MRLFRSTQQEEAGDVENDEQKHRAEETSAGEETGRHGDQQGDAEQRAVLGCTDEEIIGSYYEELKPFITRTYLLEHNEEMGQTNLKQGYFDE